LKRALSLLRSALHYRKAAFAKGLQAAGYKVVDRLPDPGPGDVVVIWNRYQGYDEQARHFERNGGRVVVVENGYLGKDWLGAQWFAMALGHHAGAGQWPEGGPERWDALGVDLRPWRHVNGSVAETLILGQRGIGEPGIASPVGWAEKTRKLVGGRIRPHPDTDARAVPLEQDLALAGSVVTWASGAALRALVEGVPVWYEMPQWIGAGAAKPLAEFGSEPKRSDAARLACFRRLIWAQWRLSEVESGEAFTRLLA
jgi:hypothetical protein